MSGAVTAAVLVIGDEILSGRTQETNARTIALFLAPLGVEVREIRVTPDDADRIVEAIHQLASRYTYLFTTGGIGPTHDDLTADAVARAFDRSIGVRDDARALLLDWYGGRNLEVTEARLRMARIPDGASLIVNPVSGAPGFQIGNVFVLAGVPAVMRGMLEDVAHRIEGGAVVTARTVRAAGLREADFADELGAIARDHPDLSIGSYPWMRTGEDGLPNFGTSLVVRGRTPETVDAATARIVEAVRALGLTPETDAAD